MARATVPVPGRISRGSAGRVTRGAGAARRLAGDGARGLASGRRVRRGAEVRLGALGEEPVWLGALGDVAARRGARARADSGARRARCSARRRDRACGAEPRPACVGGDELPGAVGGRFGSPAGGRLGVAGFDGTPVAPGATLGAPMGLGRGNRPPAPEPPPGGRTGRPGLDGRPGARRFGDCWAGGSGATAAGGGVSAGAWGPDGRLRPWVLGGPSASDDPSPSDHPSASGDASPSDDPSPSDHPSASDDPPASDDPSPSADPPASDHPSASDDPSPSELDGAPGAGFADWEGPVRSASSVTKPRGEGDRPWVAPAGIELSMTAATVIAAPASSTRRRTCVGVLGVRTDPCCERPAPP
jgi:hypothetical protein